MTRAWSVLIALILLASPAWAKREHIVHFEGTPYELNVYKITGHKPGQTLMLIGGIQGNEPGGFLSADLYADMSLERGNLIVVPRANFYSIMLNQRGPNGDMNRKFNKKKHRNDREMKVVGILKRLMAQSDLMLNLHDGSGFYRPRYVSKSMNPRRFGQSIIADCDVYTDPKTGVRLNLGGIARRVCAEINRHIDKPLYRFHFNNHRTFDPKSPNREQIGSATYYALTRVGVPAFGVETSKSLPTIELKVRHHNLAINAFMKEMGIVPENPAIKVVRPTLRYLVVSVNGQRPTVVANKETLTLRRGDSIRVSHIEANYERGLSLDVLGLGDIYDARKKFLIKRPTSIIVRKDNRQCGWVRLKVRDGAPEPVPEQNPVAQYFVVQVNAKERLVANGQTLNLIRGDRLVLKDSWTANGQKGRFALNFKGFVADRARNDGDDRNALIKTGAGLLNKWSVGGHGRRYRVVAEKGKQEYGEFYVLLESPSLDYIILTTGQGQAKFALSPDETFLVKPEEVLRLVDIKANVAADAGLRFVVRSAGRKTKLNIGQGIRLKDLRAGGSSNDRPELIIYHYETPIGRIFLAPKPVKAAHGDPDRTG